MWGERTKAMTLLAPVAVGLAVSGCLGGGTKAGGRAAKAVTLTMQTPDAPQADALYFARQVALRTHGRLRIVVGTGYSSFDPRNELRLARALRQGKVQLAYLPSRAWERDRGTVLAFRALQAPFLITGYDLLHRIATGPVGRELLASLDRNGVVGLGLVPDELRRALGRRPLASPGAFRGARIRIADSPTTVAALRALGAIPVTGLTARTAGTALAQRRLDGVESSAEYINDNGYAAHARFLAANLPLFAKTQTIAVTKRVFDELSPADRAALRAAAAATAAHADPTRRERGEVQGLCEQGLRLMTARPADVAALKREAAPVYRMLERDAATRAAIAAIERLKRQRGADDELNACARTGQAGRSGASAFPTGTFETVLTREDMRRAGFSTSDAHTERLTFRKDGTWWDVWLRPRRSDQPPGGGHYRVDGDQVTLTPANPDVLKWSYFRGLLRFQIVMDSDALGRLTYTAHPWRKVK
jgi:C4-dicarboxylate-binding protein DctP